MDIADTSVAGLFALLGAFAGAALGRRSDYEKWRRQEKSAAFAEYLRQVHAVRTACFDLIHCESGQERASDIRITEHFLDLAPQEGIVRLYLDPEDCGSFSTSAKALFNATSRDLPQGRRNSEIEAALSSIQALFERSLHRR